MSIDASAAGVSIGVEPASAAVVREVIALLATARDVDDVAPLSEQGVLRLRHDAPATEHIVARSGAGAVVGYVQLFVDDVVTAELVVSPSSRRRGIGTALASWAVSHVGASRRLQVWAHGSRTAAAALGRALGFAPQRVLHQMRRPADLPLPDAPAPLGVRIRTFRPGVDDEAWVAVNARAFAAHPEQGRLRVSDLHERMAETWFDAAGFFVAERENGDPAGLVGFHWTKVHDAPERLGEIYVVGIHPSQRGTGLGLALTVTGLEHLVSTGVPTLMLYADESNTGAVRLYERLGFTVASSDVMYEPVSPAP